MKKNIQKNKEKMFASGEVMSVLENMSDGIQLISEQHGEVVGRLDKLDGRIDKLDGRIDKLEVKVSEISKRLIRVEDNVTEIKHKLSEKVDREEFEKLEKRMIKLERLVFSKMN